MTPDDRRREAERRAAAGDARGAAELYEAAGLHFEAAQALCAAGDVPAAIASLTRVSHGDPSYSAACLLAVRLCEQQDALTLAVDNFLARFVREAPVSDVEATALDRLARLYERHGFPENAAEVLRKLSAWQPGYADAEQRLAPKAAPSAGELAELPPLPVSAPVSEAQPSEAAVESRMDERPVFHTGALIAGRYRLGERVGAGGMSVVFKAHDLEIEDEIAVKVFIQAVFNPETDARLRRELMLSRQLLHPNVVRVFDMGLALGFRYLTMELLEGTRLSDRLRAGAIPLDEGLGYLTQACSGLQAAHDLGIIHRDIKPSNLFITRQRVLKVMDFGLAKVRGAPGLTATGIVGGTPAYMAPEQATDFRAVTPASDIYALGVVAYEVFTAARPFPEENALTLLIKHREAPPPPPRSRNPSLPEELEQIILSCLEKDPARRIGSCRELGRRLKAVRDR